jgi:hypothetical protein
MQLRNALVTSGLLLLPLAARAQEPEVSQDLKHDVSGALREVIAPAGDFSAPQARYHGNIPVPPAALQPDPAVQSRAPSLYLPISQGLSFDGVGPSDSATVVFRTAGTSDSIVVLT